MSDIIKQTIKYKEYRKSQYLNLQNASDYGRHRGHVLYGCEVTPVLSSSTQVKISPGALYTCYGTKIFVDTTQIPVVDIDADCKIGGISPLAVGNNDHRPLCIAIYAQTIQDPSAPASIETGSAIGTSALTFGAALVTYNRDSGHVALNIEPVEAVDQVLDQSSAEYPHVDTVGPSQINPPDAGGPVALGRTQILIGYLYIGSDEAGDVPASLTDGSGWSDGVCFVQAKNPWEAYWDFLGLDPLLGRFDKFMATGPTGGLSALAQNYGTYDVAGNVAVPTMNPKFGTTQPADSAVPHTDPWALAWSTYRMPNFFRDGDQIIWALRRLDYVLRLWADRTGDQPLIGDIQDNTKLDHTGGEIGYTPPLAKILQNFNGGVANGTERNYNVLEWGNTDQTANATSNNQVLKSGVVSHAVTADASTTVYADSHYSAILRLEQAIQHILGDVLGRTYGRALLRQTASWTHDGSIAGLQHADDGPLNARPVAPNDGVSNRPVLGLGTSTAYLAAESLYDALDIVARRASSGSSLNWLKNPHFAQGDNANQVAGVPYGWNYGAGVTWSRQDAAGTDLLAPYADVSLPLADTTGLYQEINVAGSDFLNKVVAGGLMSAAVNLKVASAASPVIVEVTGYSGATLRFIVQSQPLDGTSWLTHGFSWKLDAGLADVTKLRITIKSPTSVLCGVSVSGVWLGAGVPRMAPAIDRQEESFLHRKGGTQSVWLGHQLAGGNDLYFGSAYADAVFTDRPILGASSGAVPVLSGGATTALLPDASPAKVAISAALARATAGTGDNLLVNPSFRHAPTATGTQAALPTGWASTGTLTWTHEGGDAKLEDTQFVLAAAATLSQQAQLLGSALSALALNALPLLSGSVVMSNSDTIRLTLQTLNSSDVVQDSAYVDVPVSATPRAISVSAKVPTTAQRFKLLIANTGGSNTIRIFGAAVNAGVANSAPMDRSDELSLSRYGGVNNAMHATLDMNSERIRNLVAAVNPDEPVRLAEISPITGLLAFTSMRFIDAYVTNSRFTASVAGTYLLAVAGGGGGGGGGGTNGGGSSGQGAAGGAGGGAGQSRLITRHMNVGDYVDFEIGAAGTAGLATVGDPNIYPTYGGNGGATLLKDSGGATLATAAGGVGGLGGTGGGWDWYSDPGPSVESAVYITATISYPVYSGGGRSNNGSMDFESYEAIDWSLAGGACRRHGGSGGGGGGVFGKFASVFVLDLARELGVQIIGGAGGIRHATVAIVPPTAGGPGCGGGGGGGAVASSFTGGQDGAAGGIGFGAVYLLTPDAP